MRTNTTYITFPIALFKSGFQDIQAALRDAIDYAGYARAAKFEYGDDAKKMKAAGKQLQITYGDPQRDFENGKRLYDLHAGTPMTSISATILFDYYDNVKSDFQIAALMGFAAVRSILQTKSFCKTNKRHIHARMFGYASIKKMPDPSAYNEAEKKYALRWHMDKVLRELEHNWGLKTFSNHTRGLYIGFQVEYETLARVNEEKKIKTKAENLKKVKAAALDAARLKTTAPASQPGHRWKTIADIFPDTLPDTFHVPVGATVHGNNNNTPQV